VPRKYLKKFYVYPNYDKRFSCQEMRSDKLKICTNIVPIGGQQSFGDNHSEADSTGVARIQHDRPYFRRNLPYDYADRWERSETWRWKSMMKMLHILFIIPYVLVSVTN